MLRSGNIAGSTFKHVVAVGHSLGGEQTVGLTSIYPSDLDAAVLTGFSVSFTGLPHFLAAFGFGIASKIVPSRFAGLPYGYLVSDSSEAVQFSDFHQPNFPQSNLDFADNIETTFTIGELFTTKQAVAPSENFTGPIDVVDGKNDFPFCQGNCYVPHDQAAAVKQALYPKASNGSDSFILPGSGHAINLHYNAQLAFENIQSFLTKNGI